jgi:hypothetical protein
MENLRNKRFLSFKTGAKREGAVTWRNPAAQTRPVLDSSSFVPFVYRLLKIRLKRQNPLLSYVQESEKVDCKCTM